MEFVNVVTVFCQKAPSKSPPVGETLKTNGKIQEYHHFISSHSASSTPY